MIKLKKNCSTCEYKNNPEKCHQILCLNYCVTTPIKQEQRILNEDVAQFMYELNKQEPKKGERNAF